VSRPQRGEKRRLVELALDNAQVSLATLRSTEAERKRIAEETLNDLAEALNLDALPHRIECFDISNIQGQMATGSMVVFEGAEPAKQAYRRFRVRCEGEPNDYAMMKEVLTRRLGAAERGDEKFLPLPDLVVVDGGKGQLNVAVHVLAEADRPELPSIGLAKEHEEVFVPGRSDPVPMTEHVRAHHLLQRVRDEAHRFAIAHHRDLRTKRSRRSALDDIPGIGPTRKRELLKAFGSIKAIKEASVEELAAVRGMSRPVAEAVKAGLSRTAR
jgi:excinuclease ABC subunit C